LQVKHNVLFNKKLPMCTPKTHRGSFLCVLFPYLPQNTNIYSKQTYEYSIDNKE